ncbi:single-stranded DNA-binding protein [Luethyella okanaganae]|uniref:Single-stranded DNA-binding protein n=1 Tax=Luethyella okanaganae TaxID=69372 RepID=A0ABW1VF94_9MICO
MSDTITVTGLVATDPKHFVTGGGLAITSFRLASSQRHFSRAKNAWVDGETNWYTISAFRQLAYNAIASVKKGDRIVATGKLKIRAWDSGERNGTTVEVEAEALGPDLAWGTAAFTRVVVAASSSPADDADATGHEPSTVDPLDAWATAGPDAAGGAESVDGAREFLPQEALRLADVDS